MEISLSKEDNKAEIVIEGDITIYNVAQGKDALLNSLNDVEELNVKLANVSEMDSAGLQLLLLLKRESLKLKKTVNIVETSSVVQNLIKQYNLTDYLGSTVQSQNIQASFDQDVSADITENSIQNDSVNKNIGDDKKSAKEFPTIESENDSNDSSGVNAVDDYFTTLVDSMGDNILPDD